MKNVFTFLLLIALSTGGCKDKTIDSSEVAATITSNIIADNFSKGCSSGGLQIKISNDTYIISNLIPTIYEDANSWPISVWIRYDPDIPDTCTQSTNRVKIITIRKDYD